MSNLGLERYLESQGLMLERAKVGDRYVLECLKKRGWVLGGESSGHIICLDRTTTGDGIGVHVYRPTDCPRTILTSLRNRYGKATPTEKAQNETQFSALWNPQDPIEVLFLRLEECFLLQKSQNLPTPSSR